MRKGRHRQPSEPPDPIAEYREWIDHRYTPGYYATQGKAPPSLKNLWSKRDRKWLGSAYVAAPAIGFALAIRAGASFDDLLVYGLGTGVYFAMGLILLFARDQPRDSAKKRDHSLTSSAEHTEK